MKFAFHNFYDILKNTFHNSDAVPGRGCWGRYPPALLRHGATTATPATGRPGPTPPSRSTGGGKLWGAAAARQAGLPRRDAAGRATGRTPCDFSEKYRFHISPAAAWGVVIGEVVTHPARGPPGPTRRPGLRLGRAAGSGEPAALRPCPSTSRASTASSWTCSPSSRPRTERAPPHTLFSLGLGVSPAPYFGPGTSFPISNIYIYTYTYI